MTDCVDVCNVVCSKLLELGYEFDDSEDYDEILKALGEVVFSKKKSYACESCSLVKTDVVWREETEQYECEECYQAWRIEQGL